MEEGITSRRQKALERREQLIDAALQVFAEKGFDASTIKDIAAAAGVTDGLIYHYFSSKEELLWAVVERRSFLPILREMMAVCENAPASEVLPRVAEEFLDLLYQNAPVSTMFIRESQTNSAVAERLGQLSHEGLSLIADYLRSRVRAGELKEINPELTGRALVGSVLLYFITRARFLSPEQKSEMKEYIDHTVRLFLYGMVK